MPILFEGFISDAVGLQETRNNWRGVSGPGFVGFSQELLLDSSFLGFLYYVSIV